MDLHNRLLILLFPNAYVKFRVVCGWLQEILGGFGWFRVVSDGFGWFAVLVLTVKLLLSDKLRIRDRINISEKG